MNKKIILAVLLVILAVAAGIFIFSKKGSDYDNTINAGNVDQSGVILFFGQGCPHCANVDKYIENNKVKDKIGFAELEVFSHQDNANLLVALAQKCALDTETLGVPFLWNGASSTCFTGDTDIIDFFKGKIGE